jgi:hypothetical protein
MDKDKLGLYIALLASCITIFTFLTGIVSVPHLLEAIGKLSGEPGVHRSISLSDQGNRSAATRIKTDHLTGQLGTARGNNAKDNVLQSILKLVIILVMYLGGIVLLLITGFLDLIVVFAGYISSSSLDIYPFSLTGKLWHYIWNEWTIGWFLMKLSGTTMVSVIALVVGVTFYGIVLMSRRA